MFSLFFIIFCLQLLCYAQAEIYAVKYNAMFFYEEFADLPATFGPTIDETLRGMLIDASPPDACTDDLLPAPPFSLIEDINRNIFSKWFLLVPRFTSTKNCTFEEKIRMAQSKGYNGVIVYNVGSDDLVPMSAKNTTGINIPSFFVGQKSGTVLNETYATDEYFIMITPQSPFDVRTHLLIPFGIVVGICFIVMVIFWVVKFIKEQRRQRRHRLPTSQLSKIATKKYQKDDPYDMCAICLETYIEGEKLRVLPCCHLYHTKCIDPWLTKNKRVCPICKRKVFVRNEPYSTSDSDSDTDTDDTTPLMRSGNHRVTQGGTFEVQNENPVQRAARSISQQSGGTNLVTASDVHSINAERISISSSDSYTSVHTSSTSSDNLDDNFKQIEVHVHQSAAANNLTGHNNDVNI